MMTLTKKDIVLDIAKETGVTQVEVKRIVQAVFDRLIQGLKEGQTIELRKFGVFKIKQRAPRRGRNPKTGQEVPVPSKRVVVFKPGLIMRQDIK